MIPVYIITKEGRSYTTKGLNTVTDMLKTDYDISDELSFFAGSAYNDPMLLADRLDKSNVTIVLSLSDRIAAFYDKNGMPDIAADLRNTADTGKTSWEIISEAFYSAQSQN